MQVLLENDAHYNGGDVKTNILAEKIKLLNTKKIDFIYALTTFYTINVEAKVMDIDFIEKYIKLPKTDIEYLSSQSGDTFLAKLIKLTQCKEADNFVTVIEKCCEMYPESVNGYSNCYKATSLMSCVSVMSHRNYIEQQYQNLKMAINYIDENPKHLKILNTLCKYEANVNFQNHYGETVLHYVNNNNNLTQTVKVLLEYDACTEIRNHSGILPFSYIINKEKYLTLIHNITKLNVKN